MIFTQDLLIEEYCHNKLTAPQIAQKYEVGLNTVKRAFKKFNIDRNSKSSQLSQVVREMLYGIILGDCSTVLQKNATNVYLKLANTSKKQKYLFSKFAALKKAGLVNMSEPRLTNVGESNESYKFNTICHPELTKLYEIFFKNGNKNLTFENLALLTPRSLAVIYQDNGGIVHEIAGAYRVRISTKVDYNQTLIFKDALKRKFDLDSSIESGSYAKPTFQLRFNAENRTKLFDLIRPYIHESLLSTLGPPSFDPIANRHENRMLKFPDKFTEEQIDFIIGKLLGDGYIGKDNEYAHMESKHSVKQFEYLKVGFKIMKDWINQDNPTITIEKSSFPGKYKDRLYGKASFVTTAHPAFNEFYNLFYKDGVKQLTPEILSRLNPRALAWFIQDDGHNGLNKARNAQYYQISTESFTKEENQLLIDWFLTEHNIKFSMEKRPNGKFRLRCSSISARKLITLIAPYVTSSMAYKIELRGASPRELKGPVN